MPMMIRIQVPELGLDERVAVRHRTPEKGQSFGEICRAHENSFSATPLIIEVGGHRLVVEVEALETGRWPYNGR